MRVTHVINCLTMGGAEMALYKHVQSTRGEVSHSVVSLLRDYPNGAKDVFTEKFLEQGIPARSLDMKPGLPDPRGVLKLARILRSERPDVVHGWMWHANLIAGVAAAPLRLPVIWDIHHADVSREHLKASSYWTNVACARLSGVLPARVVFRAEAAARSHRELGYRADRSVVIPNGFDVDAYVRDPAAGAALRAELGIAPRAPVVGLLSRLHPDKDPETFLAAARIVADRRDDVVFILAGELLDWSSAAFAARVDELRLRDRVRLLGVRRDVTALYSAMDLLASSSRTEAFPLVLGEALACGVPCVATDCGDARDIVGSSGTIVPPADPAALATAILELLARPPGERAAMGAAGRARVCERYDLHAVARRYVELYDEVTSRAAPVIAPQA